MTLLTLFLVGCAIGADTPGIEVVGTLGDARFWHEHAVEDVQVQDDGSLLSFAGCSVHRWNPDGTLLAEVRLDGCTPGLNDGILSPDGQWVAASGLWTGQQGVWRTSGGEVVHELESITWSRFCAGGLWDVDGRKGFRRLDLASGEVSHPSGDHGADFGCVDDAWMLDEHGHRIDPDGTVVELPDAGDSRKVVGQTSDGRAIVYLYGQSLVMVDHDGGLTSGGPVVDVPERVVVHQGATYVLDDGVDDVVWRIDADGRLTSRFYAEGRGLGARAGLGALFVWQDEVWAWGGHRIFALGEPSGPVDSIGEHFFFDDDELYLCHGSRCEARAVDDLGGEARIVELPHRFDSESKLSPHGRFLGQYDTEQLFRTTLDTGEVHVQPVSEWVDGLSVDARGHFKWRLSDDEDEDDIYVTKVYERRNGEEVELGSWRETSLSDPGWSVLQLGPTLRWPDGTKAGYADAENWFETASGRLFLLSGYGARLEVFDGQGDLVASSRGADTMGPWRDGGWLASGRQVSFVGPDLTRKARLTVPWSIDMLAVEGAASPDGRHFAARSPDGTLVVWRLPVDARKTEQQAPEPLASFASSLGPGARVGAPPFVVPEVPLVPSLDRWDGPLPKGLSYDGLEALGYLDESGLAIVAMAGFAPRTQQERDQDLAAIRKLSAISDDDLYTLKHHFLAVHEGGTHYDESGDEVPGDADVMARDLAAMVRRTKLRKLVELYRAWRQAQPVAEVPAYGAVGCPSQAAAVGASPPVPPSSAQTETRSLMDSILVRVAADGTPSWMATGPSTRNDAGRACFAAHDAPWTPAQRDGAPVEVCVRVPCWVSSTEE